MRVKPIKNDKKDMNPEIVCVDDSDGDSQFDDPEEVIEIEDDDNDVIVVEEEKEASKKNVSYDNKSAGEKEDIHNRKNNEYNEESWKDDDFLSFSPEIETKPSANHNKKQKKSSLDYRSNISRASLQQQPPQHQNIPVTTSVNELPPWIDPVSSSTSNHKNGSSYCTYYIPPLIKLHNEIVNFAALMSPQEDEILEREKLTIRVKELIIETFGGPDKCKVEVFGSQATGLFLPSSDIDLVVLMDDADKEQREQTMEQLNSEKDKADFEMKNWDVHEGTSPLTRLGDVLFTKWKDEISFLEVIEKTRIPIVKFTHKATNLSIDICFNQTTGVQAANLMKKFMEAMPPLKPLTFILKYFLVSRDLNEPYSGGIGSFMLQMMIVSFLQHRAREEYSAGRDSGKYTNLGSLLLEFLELYGVDFNYITTAISVRNDGYYFPKGGKGKKEYFWQVQRPNSLAMENPFDITSDVGRASFRMPLIQKSFEVSFRILLAHVSEPLQPTQSVLATILPTTQEMKSRATLLKVLNIENAVKLSGIPLPTTTNGKNSNPRNSRNRNKPQYHSDMSQSSDDSSSYLNSPQPKKRRRR